MTRATAMMVLAVLRHIRGIVTECEKWVEQTSAGENGPPPADKTRA
jgi:hypothetical protein